MCVGGKFTCKITRGIEYTIKKYSMLFPYTFITVFVSLFVRNVLTEENFTILMIFKALLESLMLIRGDSNVGVLWYLSAMLPTLPVIAIVIQKFSIKFYGTAALSVVLLWYFILHRFSDCFVPYSYTRAVAGLALGVLVYCIKEFIENHDFNKMILTIFMVMFLSFPIITTMFNIPTDEINLIFIVAGFSLCLSSKVIVFKESLLADICRQCSFPVYLVHLNIADLICWYCKNIRQLSIRTQYIVYFILTLICMLLLLCMVNLFSKLFAKRFDKVCGAK